jgi:ATP-dependent Lon protease
MGVSSSISSGLLDLAPALEALPLFPLSQAVLFPGALLPLHIFEPRYRAMIRDVLETHQSLAVVLLTDPGRSEVAGPGEESALPAIASIAGVGTIIDHAELPGGRYHILLRGRARVRLTELPFVPPYRRAAAEVLPSSSAQVPVSDLSALISTATAFSAIVHDRDKTFEFRLPKDAPAGTLADLCAHGLILDSRDRQTILETLDPVARVRRVTEVLAVQRLTLAPEHGAMN